MLQSCFVIIIKNNQLGFNFPSKCLLFKFEGISVLYRPELRLEHKVFRSLAISRLSLVIFEI
jgi:hypothetical protein